MRYKFHYILIIIAALCLMLQISPAYAADDMTVIRLDSPESAAAILHSNRSHVKKAPAQDPDKDGELSYEDFDTARRLIICDAPEDISDELSVLDPSEAYYYSEGRFYIVKYPSPADADDALNVINARHPEWNAFHDITVRCDSLSSSGNGIGAPSPYDGIAAMGLDKASSACKDVTGSLTVAVLDSGIDKDHPWFTDRLDRENSINLSEDEPDDPDAYDGFLSISGDGDHGTHVSGIITQGTPEQVGIMMVKIFGKKAKAPLSLITIAVDYASEHGAEIINMSLSQLTPQNDETALVEDAFSRALDRGCIIAAAGGN
ncbi:MAG: hypothetical protein E7220_08480, partial [Clostridiales bacterium]|nr:hypothetical protein [Clostridiales bacterium]